MEKVPMKRGGNISVQDTGYTEINDILIVGDSETSYLFSTTLHQIDTFTRVIHVIKSEDAIKILVQENFSVIIVDNDADDVEPIELSNLIRNNLPLSRIVVISKTYSVSLIKNMINSGAIDAFIPIPIDPFTGSSIIIEQYSRFQINQTLYKLISIDPPKFSPSYYLLHDPHLKSKPNRELEFVGFVIIYSSLTKYAKFYSDLLSIDEYLISGYISAISLLGQQLFQENSFFKEINFGGLSVVMHKEQDVQYLFFFKELSKSGYQIIEEEMDNIIQIFNSKYLKHFRTELPTPNHVDSGIEQLVERFHRNQQQLIDENRKQNLVLFGNQLPKLNIILSKKAEKYNISRYFDAQDVIDHLLKNETDILIINQILQEDDWNFDLASQAKDIYPSLQIVALLQSPNTSNLVKILNDDYLDFVLSYKDDAEIVEKYLDHAFDEALKIKKQMVDYHPHNIQYSLHRSVIARSMLRSFNSTFQISNIPEFYGLFIMQADLPYYCKLWPVNNNREISFDQQLFAGFVNSMEMFTDEIFDSKEEFSGFRFGDISIVIKHHFEFSFVYFLGNVDHTNFLMINRQLEINSLTMYDSIINSEGFFDFDPSHQYDVTEVIDQHLMELFIRLVSLNFI